MNRGHLRAFLERDWRAVEAEETRFWAERKAQISADELFALADRFRAGILELRPDWPTAAERSADLEAHADLARRFARVRQHADR